MKSAILGCSKSAEIQATVMTVDPSDRGGIVHGGGNPLGPQPQGMEICTFFNGYIIYFDWAIFNSKLFV